MSPVLTAATGERSLRAWHDEVRRLQRDGELDRAISLLERLIERAPEVERLRRDLVTLLRLAGRELDADRLAVELDPSDLAAWSRLLRHARRTRDLDLFVTGSLAWEAVEPDDDVVGHFAAIARSITEGTSVETASEGYVREVFDDYADRFDEHLASLGYRGPAVVADLLDGLVADGDLSADAVVADLGCGTGLVGEHLRIDDRCWDGRLLGADLSPGMLARAAARTVGDHPVYDELLEADFVAALDASAGALDAVVAADAFIYVGDLGPVFDAAAAALRSGGWLVATVEHAADGQAADHGYTPDLTGRYLHDETWLAARLAASGFDQIVIEPLSVRREGGRPVPGLVVVARAPMASSVAPWEG